jgi:hypothetical protein
MRAYETKEFFAKGAPAGRKTLLRMFSALREFTVWWRGDLDTLSVFVGNESFESLKDFKENFAGEEAERWGISVSSHDYERILSVSGRAAGTGYSIELYVSGLSKAQASDVMSEMEPYITACLAGTLPKKAVPMEMLSTSTPEERAYREREEKSRRKFETRQLVLAAALAALFGSVATILVQIFIFR